MAKTYKVTITAKAFLANVRRRAGIEVSATDGYVGELTSEQLKAIEADPLLHVAEFNPDEETADPQGDAAQIIEEANGKAQEIVDLAKQEASRLKDEAAAAAETTRSEADDYATKTREAADADAAAKKQGDQADAGQDAKNGDAKTAQAPKK